MTLAVQSRRIAVAAGAFALVSLVHLAAQLVDAGFGDAGFVDAGAVANVSQWLIVPLLAAALTAATPPPRTRLVRLVLLALAFSWLGDTAPDAFVGDTAFLVMVGCFLCAQVAYIAAFLPYRDRSLLRRPAVACYVLAVLLLVVACAPGAGALLVPALVYGLCLGAMAVLSTGLGPVAGAGGALFLLSDAMIALGAFADWFTPPAEGFWVMATYIAGQALLVSGTLRADRRHEAAVSFGAR